LPWITTSELPGTDTANVWMQSTCESSTSLASRSYTRLFRIRAPSPKKRIASTSSPAYSTCVISLFWSVTFSPLATIPVLSAPLDTKPSTMTLSASTRIPGTTVPSPR
jgi:hypothetical protein